MTKRIGVIISCRVSKLIYEMKIDNATAHHEKYSASRPWVNTTSAVAGAVYIHQDTLLDLTHSSRLDTHTELEEENIVVRTCPGPNEHSMQVTLLNACQIG